jgi:DNA-directed RNA polymerase specialized sigma24 family protein
LNKVQHAEDAEEITQDFFIAVFQKPEALRGDAAVVHYLGDGMSKTFRQRFIINN